MITFFLSVCNLTIWIFLGIFALPQAIDTSSNVGLMWLMYSLLMLYLFGNTLSSGAKLVE